MDMDEEAQLQMTPEDIDVLKAGPDTDLIVARALGRELYHCGSCGEHSEHHWCPSCSNPLPLRPKYSTTWDGAMQAAQEVGLFKRWMLSQTLQGRRWKMFPFRIASRGSILSITGPLAVCKAILRDSEMRRESDDGN